MTHLRKNSTANTYEVNADSGNGGKYGLGLQSATFQFGFISSDAEGAARTLNLFIGWSENIQLPEDESSGSCILPGLPSKYFRPHLVNRRRFQPACCFTAGKSDARRNLLQPVTEFTSVQRMQTKLTPISSNGCVLIKILATIIMGILRISETDDLQPATTNHCCRASHG